MSMNRRRLLATAAAAPLLPTAAGAVTSARAIEPDPAVVVFHRWIEARRAREEFLRTHDDWDTPEAKRHDEADWNAEDELAEIVPTTPEGAAGMFHAFLVMSGHADPIESDYRNPETFRNWDRAGEIDGTLALNLLRGLRQMMEAS